MKSKIFAGLGIMMLIATVAIVKVRAAAYDGVVGQRLSDDSETVERMIPIPDGEYRLWGSTAGRNVGSFKLGRNLVYDGDNNEIDCTCLSQSETESQINGKADVSHTQPISSITDLQSTLNSLQTQIGMVGGLATATSSGLMSSAQFTKINGIKTQLSIRVQSDGNGAYTWVYPSSTFSQAPVVSGLVEDSTSGALTNVQVTANSATSTTFQVRRAVTVLGIVNITTNPANLFVNLTAIAQ